MNATIINKHALYRALIRKSDDKHTYQKVSSAVEGNKNIISKEEAKEMCAILDEAVKMVKSNINLVSGAKRHLVHVK